MTTLNVTAIAEALKLFYLPGLRYQLNDKASAFLAQVEKNSESVSGREIRMALRFGRVGGIGNRPDDGILPTPNARKTRQAAWETKNIFARFRLTDKVIESSKSNVGAFSSMLELEIKDCETDAKLDHSRQALGDSVGILATVSGTPTHSAGVVTVNCNTTMYLAVGMLIDIRMPGGATRHADCNGREVLSVLSATQFTYSGTTNVPAANDVVVVAGNFGLELTGLAAVVNTGNILYGINRATPGNEWLNSNTINLGTAISETAIQTQIDRVEQNSGSAINFLFCSLGVRRAYQNLLTASKRVVNSLDLQGGWKALSYTGGAGEIAVVGDRYVPAGTMFGLDLNDWKMYQLADWNWLDKTGSILTQAANMAAFEATLVKYADLGCQRPSGQFVMRTITEA